MRAADFHYDYPPELVAQEPAAHRDGARLLVLDRATGAIAHRTIRDLPDLLAPGDLLVINRSRVIAARVTGERVPAGRAELLLLNETAPGTWTALGRPMRRLGRGTVVWLPGDVEAHVVANDGEQLQIALQSSNGTALRRDDVIAYLDRHGQPPLPPYIRRPHGAVHATDRARYQTVYAEQPGSAAAPTAGLHFTPELLEACTARGIDLAHVTLHVGIDTFRPVRVADLAHHQMHGEYYDVPTETLTAIARTQATGHRVVAVGTTTVRALESAAAYDRPSGCTTLFITPGHRFRTIDALLTNFHQPESTLLMLVSAFAGLAPIRTAYTTALAHHYRLFSYGDAMLIL